LRYSGWLTLTQHAAELASTGTASSSMPTILSANKTKE
jgi:hypothetical protein